MGIRVAYQPRAAAIAGPARAYGAELGRRYWETFGQRERMQQRDISARRASMERGAELQEDAEIRRQEATAEAATERFARAKEMAGVQAGISRTAREYEWGQRQKMAGEAQDLAFDERRRKEEHLLDADLMRQMSAVKSPDLAEFRAHKKRTSVLEQQLQAMPENSPMYQTRLKELEYQRSKIQGYHDQKEKYRTPTAQEDWEKNAVPIKDDDGNTVAWRYQGDTIANPAVKIKQAQDVSRARAKQAAEKQRATLQIKARAEYQKDTKEWHNDAAARRAAVRTIARDEWTRSNKEAQDALNAWKSAEDASKQGAQPSGKGITYEEALKRAEKQEPAMRSQPVEDEYLRRYGAMEERAMQAAEEGMPGGEFEPSDEVVDQPMPEDAAQLPRRPGAPITSITDIEMARKQGMSDAKIAGQIGAVPIDGKFIQTKPEFQPRIAKIFAAAKREVQPYEVRRAELQQELQAMEELKAVQQARGKPWGADDKKREEQLKKEVAALAKKAMAAWNRLDLKRLYKANPHWFRAHAVGEEAPKPIAIGGTEGLLGG